MKRMMDMYRVLGSGRGGQIAALQLCRGRRRLYVGSEMITADGWRVKLVDDDALPEVQLVAVADNALRYDFIRQVERAGFDHGALNSIHEYSRICDDVELDGFNIVKIGAHLAEGCILRSGAIVGEGAVISHDCVLGFASHVMPGAVLCGGVVVEEKATVGPGCTVLGRLRIGAGAVIDAGLLVSMDVPDLARVVRGESGKPKIVRGAA